jgi:hypothetical protein
MTQNKARRTNKIEFLQLPWAQEARGSNPRPPTTYFFIFNALFLIRLGSKPNLSPSPSLPTLSNALGEILSADDVIETRLVTAQDQHGRLKAPETL